MVQNRVLPRLMGFAILLGSLALATVAQARSSFATTFVVTNTADSGPGSLREALESANASSGTDTIIFEVDGTILLASPLPPVTEDLSIDGNGHAINIDGAGAYRIFEVPAGTNLRIFQLVLENSYGSPEGGAIWNAGVLKVQQCTLSSNVSLTGGAIYSSGSLTVVGGTAFSSNTAERGGAIYSSGALYIENAAFDGNYADGYEGGGIYTTADGVQFREVTFTNNIAVNEGGAVYNLGTLTILDSQFEDNQAWFGAVASLGGELQLQNDHFTNNLANNDGGAVYARGILEITGGSFSGNQAIRGGAVALAAEALGSIQDAAFEGNHADEDGGAILNSGSLDLIRVSLTGNNAQLHGGGIMNLGSLNVQESTISNTPDYPMVGGAIYNSGQANLNLTTLDHNLALSGPAIYNTGTMQLENATIEENHGEFGGGIYNTGELSLHDSRLNSNLADSEGGALYNTGQAELLRTTLTGNRGIDGGAILNQGNLEVQDSHFQSNRADFDFGGAIYNQRGSLRIQNTNFIGNFVPNGGGAIFNQASLQITGGLFSGNSTKWGGAIYNFNAQPVTIRGATFQHNVGAHWGGAIINNSTLLVEDTIFTANEGYEFSGGIVNSGDLIVRGSTFTENISHQGDGGALGNSGTATIEASTFISNTAYTQGGAISNRGPMASLSLTNANLEHNLAQDGGAIHNSGALDITSSTVMGNGAEQHGSGIYNAGTLEATECLFEDNGGPPIYTVEGGALYNAASANARFSQCTFHWNFAWYLGGAISNYGTLDITHTDILENEALDRGGAIHSIGDVTIQDSTLDKNDSWNYAGTISTGGTMEIVRSTISGSYSWSGGTILSSGHLQIENSTLSGNIGDYEGAALLNYGTALINYSTFAYNTDNDEDAGSMIDNRGTLEIGHSIVANPYGHRNCLGTLIATGPNISDDDSCTGFTVADPLLSALGNHGGPTLTHALLPGSPALDATPDSSCTATDQRGVPRPQGLGCDLGAFEAEQMRVRIDIRPGSSGNVIDLPSLGNIPVALLSTPGFNAPTQTDLRSLTFGAFGWEVVPLISQRTGKLLCQVSDVNSDSLPDLVCTFPIPGTNFTCTSQQGLLRGRLKDGTWMAGVDAVHPRPCP